MRPRPGYDTPDEAKQWVGAGWGPLVDRCFAALVESGLAFEVDQVKEKFGQLRFYWHPAEFRFDDPRVEAAARAVGAIEAESASVCESCGQPGATCYAHGGWVKTLCDGCMKDFHSRTPRGYGSSA